MKDIDKILSGSDKLKSAISDVNDKILSIKRQVEDTAIDKICDDIIDTNKKIIRELSNGNDLVKKLEDRKNEYRQGYESNKNAYDELRPQFEKLSDENDKREKVIKDFKKQIKINIDVIEKLKNEKEKLGSSYSSLEYSLKSAQKTREEFGETIRTQGQEIYDLKNELNRKTKELQKIMDELEAAKEPPPIKVSVIIVKGKKYLLNKQTNDVYDYDIFKANEEEVIIGKYDPEKNKIISDESSESETNDDEEEPGIKVKKITVEGKKYLVDKQTNEVYDYDIYKANEEQVIIGKYNPKTNKVTMKKSSKK